MRRTNSSKARISFAHTEGPVVLHLRAEIRKRDALIARLRSELAHAITCLNRNCITCNSKLDWAEAFLAHGEKKEKES